MLIRTFVDIYIVYAAINFSGCQPGSVRLVGGSSPQEGRIEVCTQSSPGVTVWGSVCNAQSYGIAEVVCRQLNYSRSGTFRPKEDESFLHTYVQKTIMYILYSELLSR